MHFPDYWVNKKIRDKLSGTGPVPRVVGMMNKENILTIYLLGAERFEFNILTGEITTFPPYKYNLNVDEFKVDVDLCIALYQYTCNKSNPKKKIDPYEQDRKELGITKKNISKKDDETIRKYRNAFISNKTDREIHPSKKDDGTS